MENNKLPACCGISALNTPQTFIEEDSPVGPLTLHIHPDRNRGYIIVETVLSRPHSLTDYNSTLFTTLLSLIAAPLSDCSPTLSDCGPTLSDCSLILSDCSPT